MSIPQESYPVGRSNLNVYIGIDPGSGGGIAWLCNGKVWAGAMPTTERDLWDRILDLTGQEGTATERRAVIEQQTPRPTRYFDKASQTWQSSVLASTVTLYGSYMQLRAFLTAAEIPYEDTPPKRWQAALKIVRTPKEPDTAWKNRLKERAQQLFPELKVTLYTADALLMVEYCRRVCTGTLKR